MIFYIAADVFSTFKDHIRNDVKNTKGPNISIEWK